MRVRFFHVLSIFFIVLFCSDVFAQERSIQVPVRFADGRVTSLTGLEKNGIVYAPAHGLAQILDYSYFYNPENKKIVIRVGSKSLKITARNPFILVDDDVRQMPMPTLLDDSRVFVPLILFLHATRDLLGATLDYDGTLLVKRSRFNITGVSVEEKQNGTLIHLKTAANFKESDISTSINRNWLYITLMGGTLDTLQIRSDIQQGIVDQIVSFQFENSAQVSFHINHSITDRQVFVNPEDVMVSLRTSQNVTPVKPPSNKDRWLIDRIIIDPGHGGRDPGAVGKRGTYEKDIVLAIGKKLKNLIESNMDVDVVMTRDSDTLPSLRKRIQIANENNGKLFISIHCNGLEDRRERGYSTWILGEHKFDEALNVAEKENSVIKFEESPDVNNAASHILNAIAQSSYQKESQDLARIVNGHLKSKTRLSQWKRGVYQAGFAVLVGPAMPKVLVETAFISNVYEERQLKTRSFQQKIAEALYESVKAFKSKYEQEIR